MPAVPWALPPSTCRGGSSPLAVLPEKSQAFLLGLGTQRAASAEDKHGTCFGTEGPGFSSLL